MVAGVAASWTLMGWSTGPECKLAKEWANAHRGALPDTLSALSAYPMLYRRAIYDALPATRKAALWREQLGAFRAEQRLTAAQRDVIDTVLRRMVDEAIAKGTTPPDMRREIQAAFRNSADLEQFTLLGARNPTYKSVSAALVGLRLKLRSYTAANADTYCSCAVESDWCSGKYVCMTAECTTTGGCGTLWSHTCEGFCAYIQAQ